MHMLKAPLASSIPDVTAYASPITVPIMPENSKACLAIHPALKNRIAQGKEEG